MTELKDTMGLDRRGFLTLTVGAGAGLVLGTGSAQAAANAGSFNPFVSIAPNGTITVIVKHLDKGQGAATGLATLVADELDARPEQVRTEFAPAREKVYKNFYFGDQGTGGSTAIANSFNQYRQAGAAARAMLLGAAGKSWGVSPSELMIQQGRIVHRASGRTAEIGEFASAAARLAPPANPPLKRPDQWVYIGKGFPRVEIEQKSQGAPGLYGMDVQMDNMLVATIARPPQWGARLAAVDDSAARRVKGVVGIVQIPQGVAVLATSTWPAIKGRDALKLSWDDSRAEKRSSLGLMSEYHRLSEQPGRPTKRHEDAESGLRKAVKTVEASYEFPYLAHAPMEPLDVTVLYDGQQATFWSGSQLQTLDHKKSAEILNLPTSRITINTVWAGGSFGRRGISDSHYFAEAAQLAKAWGKAQPIKIVWTREDDIRGGYYRPAYVHKVRAGVDAAGNITGWQHRVVGQSIVEGTPYEPFIVHNGIDRLSVEGIEDTTYDIGAMQLELHTTRVGVPVLWWRSVGHTHTAYVIETMIDQLAEAAGQDPVAYRLKLLSGDPRMANVLRLAADKAGWSRPTATGRHRGVAVHRSFKSIVAQVAEVSLRSDGTVKVEKVTCAVDCGVAVNPDNVKAQMEGSIGYGLGAILRNEVTMTNGKIDQTNFDTYEPLRIDDMPEVAVHIVQSSQSPTGVGEPGTPPIGPAVANAVYKATGQRVGHLPFTKHGLA